MDKAENGISLGIQSLKLNMTSGGEAPDGNMTIISSADGNTIVDAMGNLSKGLSKKIFFGQNKLIIFSESLCRENFGENMDYFIRSSDARVDVAVCISDSDAADILESTENDSNVPAENIVRLMNNGKEAAISSLVTTGELLNMHSDKTTDIYMPVLERRNKEKSVFAKGLGLFDGDRLVYVTDDDETKGIIFILDKAKNCNLEFNTEKFGKVGVQLRNIKSVGNMEIIDGKAVFNTRLKAQLMINEIEKGVVTEIDNEMMEQIKAQGEKYVRELCEKGFYACRNHSSDAVRAGEHLARDCPKEYRLMSKDWKKYFKEVEYYADADIELMKISNNTQIN